MTRTRPLVALLALPLLLAAGAALALTPEQLDEEQQACVARATGSLENPEQLCTCMVEGLAESLSESDYAALSQLMNGGAATPEGEAARETAKQIVQQCIGG